MHTPDYQGGGIVNLMASIIQARGGVSDDPPLSGLPAAELARATNLVLLVIDGLGADWLARHSPSGILNRARHRTLTSVFPPTTVAAITTYLTGVAPLQHGLTGWHTYLRELGCVMTVLTGKPRYGGVSYRAAGVDPTMLFQQTPVFDRIRTRSVIVAPHFIARSDFNRAHAGRAEMVGYDGLGDLFRQTLQVLRPRSRWKRSRPANHPAYLYLYWPALDSIGHAQGIESAAAVAHLVEIEAALAEFMTAAAGTDTLLLICADHGQIDTTSADNIELADHRELADCLLLPLCGEPRAAFCYVRASRARVFEEYCQTELKDRVNLIPSQQLLENGFFGCGTPHPRFMDRIGDYCLLPHGAGVIRDHLPGETPHVQIGVHGGLSEAELEVPLCVLTA